MHTTNKSNIVARRAVTTATLHQHMWDLDLPNNDIVSIVTHFFVWCESRPLLPYDSAPHKSCKLHLDSKPAVVSYDSHYGVLL